MNRNSINDSDREQWIDNAVIRNVTEWRNPAHYLAY